MEAKTTILLVDDDDAVRKCVGDMLERLGHAVLRAEDGSAALAMLQERAAIDLVIADRRLPGMDGLTLVRRIRELMPDLPVVIMTGYSDLESYLCAMGLGVIRYLGKPVGMRELRRTVGDALTDASRRRPHGPVRTGIR